MDRVGGWKGALWGVVWQRLRVGVPSFPGDTLQSGRALLSSSCLIVIIPSPISFVVNKMGLLIALTQGSGEI